ncbi:very short patch repair endonuclease [Pseudomonas cannabina]|uniref:Very short patch repair endonuclease n=2 Tax=Pseudomonas syringae group TaxID=136849 RepID=A0A8T8C560_PSEYM|nr:MULTISPECIES: very short patch repair endonuclease [Pseudomonas syringae group]MBM0141528.1 DNA mismatch endonuclease Vsr [Pseudomonas cannabina pv. alisalensis]QHE98506.1 DNA mismatch endonuclease Vsr [Pseudomonas syringae pv. maculicola str. ES4326]QQN23229.1 DNA mismatch endonuclease Vsr [Pseudomonas cannabina pv. alisalensis]UBY99176.1 very short patch repair endonuclease [Pseudomonas cannabina pv. alisalensis]
MTDVVDSATRSRMMAGIQAKNTSPELLIRKALHARGFRFRIHVKHLPGKPDLVLPKYSAVIFIHGCFWHGHDCRYFKVPKTRPEFWLDKIGRNQARDLVQTEASLAAGWRVLVVWECAVRAMKKQKSTLLIDQVSDWLVNGSEYFQLDEEAALG